MAGHGNRQVDAREAGRHGGGARGDFGERRRGGFGLATADVLDREQRLPRRVRVRHGRVVHERHVAHAPAHQVPRDVAAESASAQQQALRRAQSVDVQRRQQPPPHQVQVQLGRRGRELRRVRQRLELRAPRPVLPRRVSLPARRRQLFLRADFHVQHERRPVRLQTRVCLRREHVPAAAGHAEDRFVGEPRDQARHQVSHRPARLRRRRRIEAAVQHSSSSSVLFRRQRLHRQAPVVDEGGEGHGPGRQEPYLFGELAKRRAQRFP
mmetsp:Transcript_26762/g.82175  ORF Transcript_26762/g.82175 Transcript_26762/m.82175 type:complete len:267 (-) Transcript_26762:505-1305(-)